MADVVRPHANGCTTALARSRGWLRFGIRLTCEGLLLRTRV
jgi:hypothetical protein